MRAETTYEDLLGPEAWARLHPEIRRRFSARPHGEEYTRYAGTMHCVELSTMGWLFAQVCRLFGTPLAPCRGKQVRMDIELSWDEQLQGVTWSRTYHFVPDRDFTVRSTKSRSADGALTEHIGHGFSMRLALTEQNGNLVFSSTRYEVEILGRAIRIPDWLTPGVTTVLHEQVRGDRFRFVLAVVHPLLGRTIYQNGEFVPVTA
jgi:hypothetical protein